MPHRSHSTSLQTSSAAADYLLPVVTCRRTMCSFRRVARRRSSWMLPGFNPYLRIGSELSENVHTAPRALNFCASTWVTAQALSRSYERSFSRSDDGCCSKTNQNRFGREKFDRNSFGQKVHFRKQGFAR